MTDTVTIAFALPFSAEMRVGEQAVTINGWNSMQIQTLEQVGITPNVPKDLWDAWRQEFKNHDWLVKGFIYAQNTESKIKAEVKERGKNVTGLEPVKQETGQE